MVGVASSEQPADDRPLVAPEDLEDATTDSTVTIEEDGGNRLILVATEDDDVSAAVFVADDAAESDVTDVRRDLDSELQHLAGAGGQ